MENIAMHRFFKSSMFKIGAIALFAEIIILVGVRFYYNSRSFWFAAIANAAIISLVILLSFYRMQQGINLMTVKLQQTIAALKQEIVVHKQTEETLREERNMLRTLIDNLPDLVYVKDINGRFLIANTETASFIGATTPGELVGKTDFDFHPPEIARKYDTDERAVIESGKPLFNKDEPIIDRETGATRWFLTTKIPFLDRQGKIVGLVGINRDITERKRAEEALRQSKNLFQSLIEALPQNIFSKDLEGRFTFVNQRFCMTQGKSSADIIGKTDFELHPPELAEKYRADDRKVTETGQIFETVEEHQPLNREKFYVQVVKTPMYDSNGQITGILGIFWDITERRQAEEALRESEERYRYLVENAPLGIISIDPEGNIIDVNSMLAAMLGSPSIEAVRALNVFTSPSLINSGIAEDFRRCLDSGYLDLSERYYTTEWGKQVYLRYHLTPIRDNTNTITGVQAIIEDSTEQMLVERALRESEAEYRSLFKNMHSGFAYHKILIDEHHHPIDYVFLEVNEAFETLTGLKEVIGKRATEVFPELHTIEPDLIQVYGQVALTGGKTTFDSYFESFGLWFSISAYSPEQGYFVTIFEDITERKWAEESLRKLNEELEQRVEARTLELQRTNTFLQESLETLERTQKQLVESEKMAALGGLVAGVAHEINTPLGIGVTAASHLNERSREIERRYQQGEMTRSDLEKYLHTANESTAMILENLRRAAENIKSFKQVAVDQTYDTKRVFTLKQCIDNVLLSLHPKLKKTSHTVTVQCPDDLELDGYPGAFSQILTNFIMNSLIHGFEKKDQGHIELLICEEDGRLRIQYRDDGKGMSAEECSRIFEPFYTTKRSQGGSGLGLHIVYNLVRQALGGQITCESTPGSGTIFTIEIPMTQGGIHE